MKTISDELLDGLRDRYPDIHPFIFHRSVDKAQSPGELFDILETFPDKYPLIWCDKERCWKTTEDIYQRNALDRKAVKKK